MQRCGNVYRTRILHRIRDLAIIRSVTTGILSRCGEMSHRSAPGSRRCSYANCVQGVEHPIRLPGFPRPRSRVRCCGRSAQGGPTRRFMGSRPSPWTRTTPHAPRGSWGQPPIGATVRPAGCEQAGRSPGSKYAGETAPIQRCQIHKRRNVLDHLTDEQLG
jgi:hypothetical protein